MATSSFLRSLRLLAALLFLVPALASAQTLDNRGTDFIIGFNPNPIDGPPTVELHLTSSVATDVTVQYPVNAPTFNQTVAVTPGAVTVVDLPSEASTGWTSGATGNNAVRAFADDEFVVYMINRENFTSDAALALPIDALNRDYLVQTYTATFRSQFVVVAPFNNTEVTITPSQTLEGGAAAGVPFTVTLNRGEGFLAQAATSGPNGDLTGSVVSASRPVTMTNGNFCTNVPPGTSACDHIFEVAQPLASWGQDALAAPLPNRPRGSVYRVLAAEDNTVVTQNGSEVATLDAGEFYDTGVVPGAHVFSSDSEERPIFVTQFMTGVSFPEATSGDPAQGNMIPSEQYLRQYTFATVEGAFSSHFLSVIASDADVANGTVFLDGAPVDAGLFTAIPGSGFSYAVVPLEEGTHTTASTSAGHGITVEGYNSANSYLYPGGAQFEFIFQGDDLAAPDCEGSLDGRTFFGSAEDLASTDPNNTGIFFVVLSEDSENLVLDVDEFEPGAGRVEYRVTLDDMSMSGSGTVIATDGAGNTCRQPVTIRVDEPEVLACTPEAPVEFFDFDPDGGDATYGEFAGLRNFGDGLPVDLDGCSFLAFDPFTERVSYAVDTDALVDAGEEYVLATMNGDQMISSGALPDGPGAIVLAQGSYGVGASVGDVVDDVVAAVVYRADGDVFGSVRGGEGDAEALAALLAQLRAVAGEAGPDGPLALAVAPNPTAGRAAVSFGLAEAADVHVAVYDALGREVAVLARGPFGAGSHTASFDGTALPAGVYVVRVAAGPDVSVARVTIAR